MAWNGPTRAPDRTNPRNPTTTGSRNPGGRSDTSDTDLPDYVPPEDISGLFPETALATFDPATWYRSKLAPFKFTDPMKFGAQYGDFMRGEMAKNFEFGQQLGLKELDTELQGLQHFAPAAAALKRNETAIDNLFNQYMRTSQLDTTMPGMRNALKAQTDRANTYASGRLPDSMMDAAFELNNRSNAADNASAGGFGAQSSVARKASDLMSAEQRLNVGMMGEQLLGNNAQVRNALEMAPTEYSNAGLQINTMPEVGAGRLAAAAFSETNQMASIPAQTAMSSEIQQQEYRTSQMQQNRQFNTANKIQVSEFNSANALQASEFNAGQINQMGLAKFQYQAAQAGAVAGAANANTATDIGQIQQGQAQQWATSMLQSGQNAGMISSILSGAGSILGGAGGISGIMSLFGGGGNIGAGAGGAGGVTGLVPGVGEALDALSSFGLAAQIDPNSDVARAVAADNTPSSASVPKLSHFENSDSVPKASIEINTPTAASGGPTAAVPQETVAANTRAFTQDTGIRLDPTGENQQKISQALLSSGSVLNAAGVSYEQVQGQQPIGMNLAGDQMFGSTALMQSSNARAGAASAIGVGQILGGFEGLMTPQDNASLSQIGAVASSDRMQSRLDALAANQNGGAFVGAMMGGLQLGTPKDNVPAAYSAHQLYQAWDRMSPAQKSLATASLGAQNFKFSDGKTFAEKPIPSTVNTAYRPMSVAQALTLSKAGYNSYTMAGSWESMNDVYAVKTGRIGNAAQVADAGKQLNMLGFGTNGAAVPNVTATKLAQDGWKGVPSLGVGAIMGRAGARVPAGYTVVPTPKGSGNTAGVVAVPKANAQTAAVSGSGSLMGTLAGSGGVSLSAKNIYKSWGPPPAGAAEAGKGLVGGSSVLAGIYNMSPQEQAALSVSSMFKNVGSEAGAAAGAGMMAGKKPNAGGAGYMASAAQAGAAAGAALGSAEKATPEEIKAKWDAKVASGEFRLGSKAAGGYVDNKTGEWYSGVRSPEKMMNRAGNWQKLIDQGLVKRGSARAGGYVNVKTGEWYPPDSSPKKIFGDAASAAGAAIGGAGIIGRPIPPADVFGPEDVFGEGVTPV